jgi:hypothetical protein
VAIGPADLSPAEGATTIVYAWGSQDAGFQLAVQTISGSSSAPGGMAAGSGGQAGDGFPLPLAGTALAGLVVAALAGRRLLATRA